MSIKSTYISSEHLLLQSDDPKKRNFISHQAYCTVVKYLNIWLKLAIFGWKYLKQALIVVDTALVTPSNPHFWALKFAIRVASLHSLKWCKTGLPSTKLAAPACEPIRGLHEKIQIVARSKSCYMNMFKHKSRVAFVTKLWDYFYLKVGCLMSMLIALDPRGIDLAYPAEFERRSGEVVYLSNNTAIIN